MIPEPLDLGRLKILPLEERRSLTRVDDILVDPDSSPPPCSEHVASTLDDCSQKIRTARDRGAAIILIYGAHLLRNGAAQILGADDGRTLVYTPGN